MTQSVKDPVLSLLENLSSAQIESLIIEQQLLKDNYTFYYALDNHDIHRHCFPGNLTGTDFERNSNGEINYELETDRITAYDDFFNKIGGSNYCFFLDEYLGELMGLKDQIIRSFERARPFTYTDSFSKFLANYVWNTGNPLDDFTLYITVATGLLRNGAQKFNWLLNNPNLVITPEDLHDLTLNNKNLILEAFRNSQEVDLRLVGHILEIFTNSNVTRYSKRIDSRAIARVILINEYLLKHHPKEKVLFLFLSSAETSRSVFDELTNLLPCVSHYIFNFHRTVEQLFISRLISDLTIEEKVHRLESVLKLIQFREQNEDTDLQQNAEYRQLEEMALSVLHKLRTNYININLARSDQFQTTIELNAELDRFYGHIEDSDMLDASALSLQNDKGISKLKENGMSARNLKKLFNGLKKVADRFGESGQNLEYLHTLESTFKIRQIFSLVLKKAVSELLQEDSPIRISRGKDTIQATGQHLPIVFRYDLEPYGKNLDEIAELYLDQFAFYEMHAPKEIILENLRSLTASIYENKLDERSLAEKLVFCLYLLVLPDANVSRLDNSGYVEEFLSELFERELKDPATDPVLFSDFLYTYSWVLRRNQHYQKALIYAEQGIHDFPFDARFYHSRFLINVCLHPDDHTLHMGDIELAQEKYDLLLTDKSDLIATNIRAALLNSNIYTNVFLITGKQTGLAEKSQELARLRNEKLNELKALVNAHYNEYPEFLHTEATLDLEESRIATDADEKIGKLDMALSKTGEGKKQAAKLVGFNQKAFQSLEAEINKARKEIKV